MVESSTLFSHYANAFKKGHLLAKSWPSISMAPDNFFLQSCRATSEENQHRASVKAMINHNTLHACTLDLKNGGTFSNFGYLLAIFPWCHEKKNIGLERVLRNCANHLLHIKTCTFFTFMTQQRPHYSILLAGPWWKASRTGIEIATIAHLASCSSQRSSI